MSRLWQGIGRLVLWISLGLLIGWVISKVFGERLFFGFAQFALEKPLWLSLPFVAIGSLPSAIVIVELWRALFTTTPIGTKYNWFKVGVVALGCFAVQSVGLVLFKSSFT
jgi:hypothetical protein